MTIPSLIAHIIFRPIHYFEFEGLFPGEFRSPTSHFVSKLGDPLKRIPIMLG